MADNTPLADTGERMVPEYHTGKLIYAEHLVRYRAASEFARGKVVMDVASGSGYGSALLAEVAKQVHGFDVSSEAVAYATSRFAAPNLTFSVADATNIPLPDDSIDVVITFETIEHIPDYAAFMQEITRVLKPDGIAIISTPNELEFAEGNHFHLHEFERDEFTSLVKEHFANVDEYFQATWKYVAIDRMSAFETASERSLPLLNLAPINPDQCLYFYFVCSNVAITKSLAPLSALGEHYSDRAIAAKDVSDEIERKRVRDDYERQIADIMNSKSFRFARRLSAVKSRLHL
jgi:ubiquinone/menaquinone biosynthesis C-methylase UbiE